MIHKVNKKETHPSFGLVLASRVTGSRRLFDTPFEHQHFITLSIRKAARERTDLNSDYIHDEGEIIEIALSEVQFAHMITSMNMGSGTSCTIAHLDGKIIDEPGKDHTRETWGREAREHFTDLAKMAEELERLTNLPAKDVKAPQKERMRFLALKIHQAVTSSSDFFHEQFQRSMDKVVGAAKGEIQSYLLNVIQQTGIKGLKEKLKLGFSEEA